MRIFRDNADAHDADRAPAATLLESVVRSRNLWIFVGVVFALTLIVDVRYTINNGGIDLRNRVVGARLLLAGRDPYTYVWKPGDPETLLDPNVTPRTPLNRVTVTPSTLAVYGLFSNLHYRQQKLIWLLIQWACAGGVIGILMRSAPPGTSRKFMLLVLLGVFLIGDAWRLHVEVGQIYISYALLLALAYWVGRRGLARNEFASGLVLGLLTCLRPTLVLTSIPFFLSRQWRVVLGGAAGISLGVAATASVADFNVWRSYLTSMGQVGRFYLEPELRPAIAAYPVAPEVVEGMSNLTQAHKFSVQGVVFQTLFFQCFPLPYRKLLMDGSYLLLLAAGTYGLFRIWRPGRSLAACLLIGTYLAMTADFFMPTPRNAYNNILWAIPMGLLILEAGPAATLSGRMSALLWLGLALALGVVPAADHVVLNTGDLALLVYFGWISSRLARGEILEVAENVDQATVSEAQEVRLHAA